MLLLPAGRALLLAALALPASAQSPLSGMPEDRLHRSGPPDASKMGGVEPGADLPGHLASCGVGGRLQLAKKYDEDYNFTPRDKQALGRMLLAAKKYLDIKAAFKDGYLPYEQGYDDGFGVALLNPALLRDRTFLLDKPDALSYVKRRDRQEYLLVGLVYIGGSKKPQRILDFGKQSRKPEADGLARTTTWDYEEEVCVIPGRRRIATYFGEDVPEDCAGGTQYEKLWRLYAWPLVYNPQGLFYEYNPIVDLLDYKQLIQPYCGRGFSR